jgi:hypothetical protein
MKLILALLLLVSSAFAQAASTPVLAGRKVVFISSAEGTTPFTYVWYKDNVILPNETQSTLTIESVTAANAGTYKVRISNAAGFMDSNEIAIVIPQAPTRATITISIIP